MTTQTPTPADLHERARRVRLACFDVDGTLTDGRLVYDAEGGESKAFHVHDGQGLVLLRRAGIEVAFVTARTSPIVQRRAAELGVRACSGIGDKMQCVEELARELGFELAQVAFMGDDLPDLKVMQHVAVSACPADAHPWVARRAAWRAEQAGGHGAARAFCDFILEAQGRVDALIDELLAPRPVALGARA
ncbi:KdsC family phosphatase [Cognatilysobacter lacus]|uniref:3-deoxy-D-manno-octulosonate 8-phosphate phosphatase KdsC n=1 Tax=Cognatilysobacter lacus TaxID=1643323 RepID=A0A5D8ZAE1_9GAMM|nr:HAD hydrolase family protein [Lysobacter lacus]TZF91600.1 HAD hydrolase family protein [Lysobacter lacus]